MAQYLDKTGLTTLVNELKNQAGYIKCITSSELNSLTTVATDGPHIFQVTDINAIMIMTTDASNHITYQTLYGEFLLNNGTLTTSHKDGLCSTAIRAYLTSPTTLPSYLGYSTSDYGKWSVWHQMGMRGIAKAWDTIDPIVGYYGNLRWLTVTSANKLQLYGAGGTLGNTATIGFNNATSSVAGFMSTTDKAKMDMLPESITFANADNATTLKYGTVGSIGEAVVMEEVFTDYIRITIQCHESEDQTYYVTQYDNVNAWLNKWSYAYDGNMYCQTHVVVIPKMKYRIHY